MKNNPLISCCGSDKQPPYKQLWQRQISSLLVAMVATYSLLIIRYGSYIQPLYKSLWQLHIATSLENWKFFNFGECPDDQKICLGQIICRPHFLIVFKNFKTYAKNIPMGKSLLNRFLIFLSNFCMRLSKMLRKISLKHGRKCCANFT